MKTEKKRTLGVRVPDAVLERLSKLAQKQRRTLSDYVRLVLEDHVRRAA
jgi:predicted DNA-binding protein